MRSLGCLKCIYICIHRLLCITHNANHRGFPEYLAQSITIQSSNSYSRKFHIMKLMQRSTSLVFSASVFSVISPKRWKLLPYDIRCVISLSLFKRKLYTVCTYISILSHFNTFYFIIRFLFIFVFYYLTRL